MTEFYQWASENFFDFAAVTTVLALAIAMVVSEWRGK